MAESDNYIKVRDGKHSKEFFFTLKNFGVIYRSAMKHRDACVREGGIPVLSVFTHPSYKGKSLLPIEVPCVGGCERCAPAVPGLDPDADGN
jgi:hypothetical protein